MLRVPHHLFTWLVFALALSIAPANATPAVTSLHDIQWKERVVAEDSTHVLRGVSYAKLDDGEIAVVHVDIPGDKSDRYDFYALRDGQPTRVGQIGPNWRTADFVYSIDVREHELVIKRLSHAAKDAACCPSLARDEHWVLRGDRLVENAARRTLGKAPQPTALRQVAEQLTGLWRGTVVVPTVNVPTADVAWHYNCLKEHSGGVVDRRSASDLPHDFQGVSVGNVTSCDESTGCCKIASHRRADRASLDGLCFEEPRAGERDCHR